MSLDDAIKLIQQTANVPLSEQKITCAYALSKHTIKNEMAEFEKY